MTVLVTGGAGYIGSHMVYALLDRGERVVVLDNLSTGFRSLVSNEAAFVLGEVSNRPLVRQLIAEHGIDAAIHFAGSIVVPESVRQPLRYHANNTVASHALVEACVEGGMKHFIFSSTATVYGPDAKQPLAEDAPKGPISPYASSKLMTEMMLADVSRAHDFRHMVLRYFNVAGADPKGRTGQSNLPATSLIKRAAQVALGQMPYLDIFGTDYPTPDGTCVRDYVHVSDLANAHLLLLDALRAGSRPDTFNCGYGRGFSVREVVREMEAAIGGTLPIREGPRRAGDPPSLISDSTKLRATLNWRPEYADIGEIIRSALEWERHSNN